MATGATSGDVIQLQVQFVTQTNIEELVRNEIAKLKAGFSRQVNVDLNLHFNLGSVDKEIASFVNLTKETIRTRLGAMGNSPVTVNGLKLQLAQGGKGVDLGQNFQQQMGKAISDTVQNRKPIKVNLKLQADKIEFDGAKLSKTIQDEINKITQNMNAAAKLQQSQTKALSGSNLLGSSKTGSASSSTLLADTKAKLQEAQAIRKQIEDTLKTMDKTDPKSSAYNQMAMQVVDLQQKLQRLVSDMERVKTANKDMFSVSKGDGQLLAAAAGIDSEMAKVTNAIDSYKQKSQEIRLASQEGAAALNLLNRALTEFQNAQSSLKASGQYGLDQAQRGQALQAAEASFKNGVAFLQQFDQQASSSVQKLGVVQQKFAEVMSAMSKTSTMQGQSQLFTDELQLRVEKMMTTLQKLQSEAQNLGNISLSGKLGAFRSELEQLASSSQITEKAVMEASKTLARLQTETVGAKLQNQFDVTKVKDIASGFKNAFSEIKSIASDMKTMTPGTDGWDALKVRLQELQTVYRSLYDSMQKFKTDNANLFSGSTANQQLVNMSQQIETLHTRSEAAMNKELSKIQEIENEYSKLSTAKQLYSKAVESQAKAQSTTSQTEKARLEQLSQTYKAQADQLREAFLNAFPKGSELRGATAIKQVLAEMEAEMKKLETTSSSSAGKVAANNEKLRSSYQGLLNVMQKYQQNTPRLQGRQIGTDLNNLINSVNGSLTTGKFDTTQLNAIRAQFNAIQDAARSAGLESRTFGQNFAQAMQNFAGWFSASMLVMKGIEQVKQMIEYTKQLDTSMTELKKVTDESDATYSRFLDQAANKSMEVGAKLTDVVDSTAEFARLGYNINESLQLSEAAIMLKNVGDGIESASDASEKIISAMKAFDVAPQEALSIVDKYNEVGNNFAISSSGIAEALERSAAALSQAGNSLDESIALTVGKRVSAHVCSSIGERRSY